MCEQGQAAAGERFGGVLVGAGCYVDDLPGAGGQEHGQDGADTPADSRGGSVGGVVRGLPVVGLGERARGDRERERRDAASRVGLGCGVPVRIASGSVLLREVSVTTCGGGRIFLSGGPGPVGPVLVFRGGTLSEYFDVIDAFYLETVPPSFYEGLPPCGV